MYYESHVLRVLEAGKDVRFCLLSAAEDLDQYDRVIARCVEYGIL